MTAQPAASKMTLPELAAMRARGDRIVMVTAYDAPSGRLADDAGVDIVLVGDSAGTTVLGGTSTVPVTLDEMLVFTRGVVRGVSHALVIADMPFGSYQVSDAAALDHAIRLVKEGGADGVKLEGAGATLTRIAAIVDAGIPVMGHIGLTPQSATLLGGYRAQGRTADAARRLIDDARALERAGAFAIVLEAIPAIVAERVTAEIGVPTIGIGAGASCCGQVLVWHDLLGLTRGSTPRFVKRYADLNGVIAGALDAFVQDVRGGTFPGPDHTYGMPDTEREKLDDAKVER
ncbi:MAG TPA: 3-methyl-2-oxobutanoate hydroxymethyltransferase [Vicinamibacterales bacterium]|jgi:3-methyl-2-oxobutanoate hydroxymethyltransferase|nr:3-methyl-2-oxobutanoate hydroxymethyltransferase [Vicinamibacterales bacterium]